MNLVQALRLVRMDANVFEELPCLALVGAGGKTTALFQIGRQLPGPVILTATTHLAVHQASLADHHIIARNPGDLEGLEFPPLAKVMLVTGSRVEEARLSGVQAPILDWLKRFTEENQIPLLIEADGSRQRPVKAPGENEPALPSFVRQVCTVAGLSALGKPLNEEWVHRPEKFAALSGIEPGSAITVDGLVQVLNSPEGGLKNIPAGARRIVLLTQVDTDERCLDAGRLSRLLLPSYDAILAVSLQPAGAKKYREKPEKSSFPVILPEPVVTSVHEPVAGILLAAGGSSRMGRPKQLLPWNGKPMVRYVALKALAAGLSPVLVVTGAFHEQVSRAVADLPVTLIHNQEWESGQSSSLRAGLMRLPRETGSALFLLIDQPQVPVDLMRSLIALHAETLAPVVAPRVGEKRANPVLFDRQTFSDLTSIQGDVGGRALFSRYPVAWLDWPDENLLLDIDTEEDYHSLRNAPLL
jgi:molybdenum cofactor cytidylyltransferase